MNKYSKIAIAFLNGNSLIRQTIASKIKFKVKKNAYYKTKNSPEFLHLIDIESLRGCECIDNSTVSHYLKHEYNFLGSGWTNWSPVVDDEISYQKIEWHRDLLFGYEFTEDFFNSDLITGLPKGTDVKIPWEMGRMYHWPQLAIYAVNHEEISSEIVHEFIAQMNDFIDNNPVGIGVQYYCAMEVAIRAINLLVGYDILSQLGQDTFDIEFQRKFERHLYRYLQVIIDRLEINLFNDHTGNHYLSDLCGILWICMYFPSKVSRKWGKVAVAEFAKEIEKQFLEDGSNFECSSGYHVLSAELTILGIMAARPYLDSTKKSILSNKARSILFAIDVFIAIDKKLIQIGDNDSGRVLKLLPSYIAEKENCLSIMDIKGLTDYLLYGDQNNCSPYINLLKAYGVLDLFDERDNNSGKELIKHCEECLENEIDYEKMPYVTYQEIPLRGGMNKFQVCSLLDFGLIKISFSKVADIYIRSVPNYKKMDISHAHSDIFSYQVIYEEDRIGEDLGSIAYTSDIDVRYYFAGQSSHNVPIHSVPSLKRNGVFEAESEVIGTTCIKDNSVIVQANWNGINHVREFIIETEKMIINDYSDEEFIINTVDDKYYSLGYGQLYRRGTDEHIRSIPKK